MFGTLAIIRGAQAAYAAIINRWQSHRGPTNWIHFDNVGHWGTAYDTPWVSGRDGGVRFGPEPLVLGKLRRADRRGG